MRALVVPSLVASCLALASISCGGSAPSPVDPTPRDEAALDSAESPPSEPQEPARPHCDDESCTICGDGFCPLGAYCELRAGGASACAWLAECPQSPSCSCLGKVLDKGCTCTETTPGPTVRCDP